MAAKTPKEKKPPKKRELDLGRLLNAVSYKNYNFYDSLNNAELKEFSPWILMRFTSNVRVTDRRASSEVRHDIEEYMIEMTNELVNKNHKEIAKRPELLWKLYAASGTNLDCDYKYLPALKNEFDKFEKLIAELNPAMKIDEVKMLAAMMDKQDRIELFDKMGFDKKQRKEYE
jgi:hypothetical protein